MVSNSSLESYYSELRHVLSKTKSDKELFESIANAPFTNKLQTTMLDLGIVVFLMVNKKKKSIDRIALSKTEQAEWAIKMTPVPFHQIRIPLAHDENIISKTIATKKVHNTTDWNYLFTPTLAAESARFNQAGAGIACSFVYPVDARDGCAIIFSYFQPINHIKSVHKAFMQKYCNIVAEYLNK